MYVEYMYNKKEIPKVKRSSTFIFFNFAFADECLNKFSRQSSACLFFHLNEIVAVVHNKIVWNIFISQTTYFWADNIRCRFSTRC